MMVSSLFIIVSYGTFCVHSKISIISTVVLPTTEIIEPEKFTSKFTLFLPYCFRDSKANAPTAIGTILEVLT